MRLRHVRLTQIPIVDASPPAHLQLEPAAVPPADVRLESDHRLRRAVRDLGIHLARDQGRAARPPADQLRGHSLRDRRRDLLRDHRGDRGVRLPWAARDWRLLLWTGLLSITINYALVFWAELHISSGLAAVLNATIPLFGLPLAHRALPSEPMTPYKVSGVVLGVLGLAIVFGAELGGDSPLAMAASLGVLVASLAGAQAGVLIKAKGTHLDPSVLAGVQMAAGSIPLLVLGGLLEGNPLRFDWTPSAVASLAYLTIVGSVIAFLAYYWLIRNIEVTRVLLIPLITPLVALALGFVFLGEHVGWGTALGGTAILGGVALAVWNGGRK